MKLINCFNSSLFKKPELKAMHSVLSLDIPVSRVKYKECEILPVKSLFDEITSIEILSINDPESTLRDLLIKRALQLISESKELNLPLCVKYSGGIDSLAVISTLHYLGADYRVYMSPDSYLESPLAFKKFIAGKTIRHSNCKSQFEGLVITGDGGDALHIDTQYLAMLRKTGIEMLDRSDWKDVFIQFMPSIPRYNKWVLELIEPALDESPWRIKTVRDLFSWTPLAIFYQSEIFRFLNTLPDIQTNFYKMRPFFTPVEFTQWALSVDPKIRYPSSYNYRPIIRTVCEKLLGSSLNHLRKDFSLWKTTIMTPLRAGVWEDLSTASPEEIDLCVKPITFAGDIR